jgi:hypothetical protein
VKLSLFMMPLHDPGKPLHQVLSEDTEAFGVPHDKSLRPPAA